MKSVLVALLLLFLAACSSSPSSSAGPRLSCGVIERVEPVELRSLSASTDDVPDEGDDDARRYGDRVDVLLDDGRSVHLLYTGPRRFQPGQAVRVGLGASSAFIL